MLASPADVRSTLDHLSVVSLGSVSCTQFYAESGWNLNNLPMQKGCVLRHIDRDISGMKVRHCLTIGGSVDVGGIYVRVVCVHVCTYCTYVRTFVCLYV